MKTIDEAVAMLRFEIDEDKKRVHEKEAALSILLRMTEDKQQTQQNKTVEAENSSSTHAIFDVADLGGSAHEKRHTFMDDVKDAASRFGDQEFTVANIDAGLQRLGVGSSDKSLRSRISVALGKLYAEGYLVRTFEGRGSVPHVFKLNKGQSSHNTNEAALSGQQDDPKKEEIPPESEF